MVNPSHAQPADAHGSVQYSHALPPPCEASLELMAGQMIMVGFRGISTEANPIIQVMNKTFLGGVILFDNDYSPRVFIRNISSKAQLSGLTASLQAHSPYPLLVAVDQEGGKVRRLKWEKGFTPLPPAAELGEAPPNATRLTAGRAAAEMQMLGINLNFAPVADVNINPDSPAIGALQRSFSAEPQAVARHAGAFLQGMKAHGVAGCLKHFPGHGSAAADTHLGSVDISETWAPDAELLPYKTLIKEGLAE
ncbi:MAG: glycoside hydrolase family 3, partial [Desulfovibrionaceae bacterium]|nr:glycoside hydrolase family 3 [Desulfovibrionaceae bacterium]